MHIYIYIYNNYIYYDESYAFTVYIPHTNLCCIHNFSIVYYMNGFYWLMLCGIGMKQKMRHTNSINSQFGQHYALHTLVTVHCPSPNSSRLYMNSLFHSVTLNQNLCGGWDHVQQVALKRLHLKRPIITYIWN